MKKTDIAYIAGLIDGEGYVGIKKTKAYKCQGRATPGYHARVQIRMVDELAIAFLAKTLGGAFWKEKPNANHGRPLYCWSLSDKAAEKALRVVYPFLLVKRKQCSIIFSLRALQGEGQKHRTKTTGYRNFPNRAGTVRRVANKCFSDEYVAKCESFRMDCRNLNGLARFNL